MQGTDIVKGLELCTSGDCGNCPYKQYGRMCREHLMENSLEFIKALKWTNKHLIKTEKERRRELWTKAVKQFAEKLENGQSIENIVKEMINK